MTREDVDQHRIYIARAQCGCIVAVMTHDCPDRHQELAKWARQGLEIDRCTNGDFKAGKAGEFGCVHVVDKPRKRTKPPSAKQLAFEMRQ